MQVNYKPSFPSVVINKNGETPLSKDRLSNKYSPSFLRALEYVYGSEGIISSGGTESVDAMLKNVNLDGKKLLDVGCGFGGVDLYLAKKYKVIISGVDREPFMIECANQLLERSSTPLKGRVTYQTLSDPLSLKEFADNTFDVVFSKQVFYHLPPTKRELYLREIYRVVKPGGLYITEDWLTAHQPYTELVKKALNIDALKENQEPFSFLVTPDEYGLAIGNAGFEDIHHIDNTEQQIYYTENDVQRIQDSSTPFSEELSEGTHKHVKNSWDNFITAMKCHEVISGIFTGIKMINPFDALGTIFTEISANNTLNLWWNKAEIEARVSYFCQKVINLIEHPPDTGIKPSDIFKLKGQISHLRKSEPGKSNYGACEDCIRKIEDAIDKHCKNLCVEYGVIHDFCLKEGICPQNLLCVLIKVFQEDGIPLSIAFNSLNPLPFTYPEAFDLLYSLLKKSPNKVEHFDLITKHLFEDDTSGAIYVKFQLLNEQADGGYKLLKHACPIFEMHRSYAIENPSPMITETLGTEKQKYQINKMFVLKALSLLLEEEDEIDIGILKQLFSNKTLDKSVIDLLKILQKIPKERRKKTLLHAADLFPQLELWEKLGIENIHLLGKNSSLFEKINEVFPKLEFICEYCDENEKETRCKLLDFLISTGLENEYRLHLINKRISLIMELFNERIILMGELLNGKMILLNELEGRSREGFFFDRLLKCIYYLSDVSDDQEMSDIMKHYYRLAGDRGDVDFRHGKRIPVLASLPKEERTKFVNSVLGVFIDYIRAYNSPSSYSGPHRRAKVWEAENDIILGMRLLHNRVVHNRERMSLSSFLPLIVRPKENFPFNNLEFNTFFEICLFLSSPCFFDEYSKCLDSNHPMSLEKYKEILMASINDKLANPKDYPPIIIEAVKEVCAYLLSDAIGAAMKVVQLRLEKGIDLPVDMIHQIALKEFYLEFPHTQALKEIFQKYRTERQVTGH